MDNIIPLFLKLQNSLISPLKRPKLLTLNTATTRVIIITIVVSHRGIKESSKTCASLDRALVDALSKRLKTIHVYHCRGHCDHHTKDS